MPTPGQLATPTTTGFEFNELTKSDVTEYGVEVGLKAVMAMTAGDAVLVDHNDTSTTITVVAGQYLYLRPKKFMSTGTTCTLLGIFS